MRFASQILRPLASAVSLYEPLAKAEGVSLAIYHCSVKVISRSGGRSATGSAAYRSGEKILDNRSGLTHDYSRKTGVDYSEIVKPENAPEWCSDRSKLWNEVEKTEKRKDAQLCREVVVALPRELTIEQMRELTTSFSESTFVQKGMIADINIHDSKSDNPHAHILLTTREINSKSFGKKNRDWNKKDQLKSWRESWEKQANKALEKAGHEQRINHRTLEEQGIDRIPQIHLGAKVVEMEQRGANTDRGARALEIDDTNTKIIQLQNHRDALEHERHNKTKTSKKPRPISSRDRAISASLSVTVGRASNEFEETRAGQPRSSRAVGGLPEENSENMERFSIRNCLLYTSPSPRDRG